MSNVNVIDQIARVSDGGMYAIVALGLVLLIAIRADVL